MAPLIKVNTRYLLIVGLFIVFFQNLFGFVPELLPENIRESISSPWEFFYPTASRSSSLSGTSGLKNVFGISILYVLIPWIGVMICGFVFGSALSRGKAYFIRVARITGFVATGLFIVAAIVFAMGDEAQTPFLYKVLGQRKYPASQLYLLMTLGPALLLISFAENLGGTFWNMVKNVGRVPMFFYLLHIPLIHLSAFVVNALRDGVSHQNWYSTAPLVGVPKEEQWPLYLLYMVWVADTFVLIKACQWYSNYKKAHPQNKWLQYV
jgi:uncharacterized membrane protein